MRKIMPGYRYALSRLPEKFQHGAEPTSQFAKYRAAKYGDFGFKKSGHIEYNQEWTPDYNRHARYRWVEHPKDGLRLRGSVHEIQREKRQRVEHTGWYIDNYQNETCHGLVFQLPGKGGEPRYVPAVSDPNNDGVIMDFYSVMDDLADAVRWADSMAESYAESCRESEAKYEAEQRKDEITEEIKTLYSDFKELARELRANCKALEGMPLLRKTLRQNWLSTKAQIRELRKEWDKLDEDYWEAVPR